jgi:hypothetical protein
MRSFPLRYYLVFSSALYAAGLALFGFSFGGSGAPVQPPLVCFGQLLPGYAVAPRLQPSPAGKPAGIGQERFIPGPAVADGPVVAHSSPKPYGFILLASNRPEFPFPAAPASFIRGKDSVVMIHPLLPYQLQLYFKDRQSVHLELMFMVTSNRSKKFIEIKRKISSGNLEADLLCSRYLGHYLFIQQGRFALNSWQTVKIDLSR